jgi:hypothetical protein
MPHRKIWDHDLQVLIYKDLVDLPSEGKQLSTDR